MKNIPELLVPAGGVEQLKAAVSCGADAVYLGGPSFSARSRAENFTEKALREAIQYAHTFGVKVHVALNTLLTDRELPEALNFSAGIYSYGADAVIVQDTGLFALIRRCIPELPLHLSTQGTVTDLNGVRAAVERGAERVILARELSLEEIREICRSKGSTEIEIFVHGAICIGLSGQCHMSGMIGTRSGNRGDCAQPCRMRYTLEQTEKGAVSEGYQLSPKDMCLLAHLEQIAETGVDSIKIEGRMKSPEYVAAVTSLYRKHLDLIRNGDREKAAQCVPEDLRILRQMYSRGTFTDGYLRGSAYAELMSGLSPKHQGLLVGKMLDFHKKSGHAAIRLTERLSIGDGVEILGKKGTADNVVTWLKDMKGRMLREAEKGNTVEVGDLRVKGGVPEKGADVYRLTDKKLLQDLRQSYSRTTQRVPVRFRLIAAEGAPLLLKGAAGDNGTVFRAAAAGKELLEPIRSGVTDEKTLSGKLSKTGGTPYYCEDVEIQIVGNPFVQVSALNSLRRQVLEDLTEQRLRASKPSEEKVTEIFRVCERVFTSEIFLTENSRKSETVPVSESLSGEGQIAESFPKGLGTAAEKHADERNEQEQSRFQVYFYDTPDAEERLRAFLRILKMSGIQRDRLILCLPLDFLVRSAEKTDVEHLIEESGCRLDAVFPVELRKSGLTEEQAEAQLRKLRTWQSFRAAMIADPGQLYPVKRADVRFETDRHLNILNSRSAEYWLSEGALSVCLTEEPEAFRSFAFDKVSAGCCVDVYGRLPVMYLEHCPIGSHGLGAWRSAAAEKSVCCEAGKKSYYCRQGGWRLRDRTGALYPVEADSRSCRAVVYSHRKIDHFAEKTRLIRSGVRLFRISCLDESPEKVLRVIKEWMA